MASQLYQQLMTPQRLTENAAVISVADSAKRMVNMLNSSGNPQQIMQMIAQSNPQVGAIMNALNTSGMSPKGLFYTMAQQRGVDPNQIIAMLK